MPTRRWGDMLEGKGGCEWWIGNDRDYWMVFTIGGVVIVPPWSGIFFF